MALPWIVFFTKIYNLWNKSFHMGVNKFLNRNYEPWKQKTASDVTKEPWLFWRKDAICMRLKHLALNLQKYQPVENDIHFSISIVYFFN